MIKSTFYSIILLLAFSNLITAQKLDKEVVYTLQVNEIVYYGEYFAHLYTTEKGFAVVVEDTIKSEHHLVLNGKKVASGEYISGMQVDFMKPEDFAVITYAQDQFFFFNKNGKYGPYSDYKYINENDSYFGVMKGEQWFIIHKDNELGPFEDVDVYTDNMPYDYKYKKGGEWYAVSGGKTIGPFEKENSFKINDADYSMYISKGTEENNWMNINGVTIGPYKSNRYGDTYEHYYFDMSENGKYVYFSSPSSDGEYVYINGQNESLRALLKEATGKSYTFASGIRPKVANSGAYIYGIEAKVNSGATAEIYINANGQFYGPFKKPGNRHGLPTAISDNGQFAFGIEDETGGNYVFVNDKFYGPYNYLNGEIVIDDSGNFAFAFGDNSYSDFVNIAGTQRGPYTMVRNMRIAPNNEFSFDYMEYGQGGIVRNYSGGFTKIKKEQVAFPSPFWIEQDEIRSTRSDDKLKTDMDGITINGEKVSDYPAYRAWYNEYNNSFKWQSIQGRQLVVFTYKL